MAAAAATAAHLLAILVVAASLAAGAAALRSLGVRKGAGDAVADGNAAVDLNATNFDAFLKASPESFAVVEFFAHWPVQPPPASMPPARPALAPALKLTADDALLFLRAMKDSLPDQREKYDEFMETMCEFKSGRSVMH